jgi:SAM-dependent methyltransferase
MMRLNLGCGRDVREGWVNVDLNEAPGVVPADLNRPTWYHELSGILPPDELVEHSDAFHVIEHLTNPLGFMQGLYAVTKPGGTVEIRCPHGGSDDAWEDPTHVRPWFENSFGVFAAPYYWRADYGYHADWQATAVELHLMPGFESYPEYKVAHALRHQRNMVFEMRALLECVKPAREPRRELQQVPVVTYHAP